MPRGRAPSRVDANQSVLVKTMRQMGATVWITSAIGDGGADVVVGIRGINLLVEIKDGSKPPSKQRLTEEEEKFHANWKGQICIVRSMEEAVQLINNTG